MNENLQDLINGIGALGEISGIMRDVLTENGFNRQEACYIVAMVISTVIEKGMK